MGDFLQYLVSLYGEELYKDKQRLCYLIADLYRGEERQKRLFRRAILEDNLARRVYDLTQKSSSERKALEDAIAYRFAENNYLTNEIGKKVTSAFIKGIEQLVEISWTRTYLGFGDYYGWKDNQGCIYNNNKMILLKGNPSLSKIIIENGTIEIGEGAFLNCTSLVNTTIPDSVRYIGKKAFEGCTSLKEINIPDSVLEIGKYAFEGCTSLKNIKIPNSVTTIGEWAFKGCMSLVGINIPDSVTIIGSGAFLGCELLTDIKIPSNVTTIREWTFSYNTSLVNITIPDSIRYIGRSAFKGCKSLTDIKIPNSVTEIKERAFECCTSLLQR